MDIINSSPARPATASRTILSVSTLNNPPPTGSLSAFPPRNRSRSFLQIQPDYLTSGSAFCQASAGFSPSFCCIFRSFCRRYLSIPAKLPVPFRRRELPPLRPGCLYGSVFSPILPLPGRDNMIISLQRQTRCHRKAHRTERLRKSLRQTTEGPLPQPFPVPCPLRDSVPYFITSRLRSAT